MSLVNDEYFPVDGAERRLVDGDELVGRQQHVEFHAHVLLHAKRLVAAADCTLLKRELMLSALHKNTHYTHAWLNGICPGGSTQQSLKQKL